MSQSVKEQTIPAWVLRGRLRCAGCHDDIYNYRANCNGKSYCWSLKPSYARRKTKPPCYH